MTKLEKVIKGLEACIKRDCRENACTYGNMSHGCLNALYTDALELLKEREPVKPTLAVDTWICSQCGHTLESQELIVKENLVHETYSFCPNCGKAVKWDYE